MSNRFPKVYVPVGGTLNTTKGVIVCENVGKGEKCDQCVIGDYNCFGYACDQTERPDGLDVVFKYEKGGAK